MSQTPRLAIQPDQLTNQQIQLTPDQQHYVLRVLRLTTGDRLVVMDGQGHSWWAEVADPPEALQITAAIATPPDLTPAIHLVAALPKGNAFDEVVRQVTELGVRQISPVISDRTLLQPSPKKVDRWRRIATEAAEQSERQFIPTIAAPCPLADLWPTLADDSAAYLCVARRSVPSLLATLQAQATDPPATITLVVGPEGGWTEREVEQAIAHKIIPVSLGRAVLRAVTAAVTAVAIAAIAWPDSEADLPPPPANR